MIAFTIRLCLLSLSQGYQWGEVERKQEAADWEKASMGGAVPPVEGATPSPRRRFTPARAAMTVEAAAAAAAAAEEDVPAPSGRGALAAGADGEFATSWA